MDLGSSARGGRKPLDTTINLVPFIDLMAVTIAFLIMTAVWTQIGRLPVTQSGAAPSEPAPVDSVPLTLHLTDRTLTLTIGGQTFDPLPITRDARQHLDVEPLKEKLASARAAAPDQHAITLQADDSVRYEDLVRIIDACIGADLAGVTVSPAS